MLSHVKQKVKLVRKLKINTFNQGAGNET